MTEYQKAKKEATKKNLKVFRPIDKDSSYDPQTFVKAQGQLNDITGYIHALNQPNGGANIGARRDLSEKLYGDSNEQLRRTDTQLMSEARDAESSAVENMGRYIEHNSGQVMNRLDGNSLATLVRNSHPLYLTGNKQHDEVVADIIELRAMNSSDEKMVAQAQKSMMDRINNDEEVPDWIKVSIQRYNTLESPFVSMIFARYSAGQKKALDSYLTKGGKPDETKLKALINNSLRAAYDKFDDVPKGKEHDGERSDIWEQNLRPCYLEIAKELRSLEKRKLEAKDSKKQEEKAREKERQSLGMAA
jgi:hypothetical protein